MRFRKWWQKQKRGWRAFVEVSFRFKKYMQNRKGRIATTIALSLVLTALQVLEPWPLKMVIDNVLLGSALPGFFPEFLLNGSDNRLSLLYVLVGAIIILAFFRGLIYYHQRLAMSRLGIYMTTAIRADLYRHLQFLSLSFHDRRRTGDIIVRLTSDIRMLRMAFVSLPVELLQSVFLMVGMSVVMFFMDWQLALLAMALLPVSSLLVRRYQRPMRTAIRQQREREGQMATIATESLGAMRLVQGFHREKDEIERFGGANKKDQKSSVRTARLEAKLRWTSELAVAVVITLIILVASRRILNGLLSIGDLIVFITYLKLFTRPLRRLSKITERIVRSAAAGERILKILDVEPEIVNKPAAVQAPRFKGHIVFDKVSFSYNDKDLALDNIELNIAPGQRVALVGPSGSGKSTIVSLISRFYDPTVGRVLIDELDIRDYTLRSLRRQVGYVFQDPLLFATTIAENIAYGRHDATPEDVEQAARRAGVHDVIAQLPDGYETTVGERGCQLSGGQKQCISVARAMIAKTPIVILDELTTGLDAENASLVTRAVKKLIADRTCIFISHHLQDVEEVDQVFVLDQGRIIQAGTPDDLADRDGPYRRYRHLQALS